MNEKYIWIDLVNRNKNFHNTIINSEADDLESKIFFENLYNFKEELVQKLNEKDMTNTQKLDLFFHEMFKFTVFQGFEFTYFIEGFAVDENIFLFDSVFEACLYTSLCMFLHNSKRIQGKRLREIVYEHSQYNYKEKGYKIDNYANGLSEEEASFRKMRNRILSERSVYDSRKKWQTVSKDSEYEWSLYFNLENLNDDLRDTYKRIGNLYNDIKKALILPKDDDYINKLQQAYDKFVSKLKKIKYGNYLALQKEIMKYLYKDKKYYGINIYRYEKELMLYKITSETKTLLKYYDDEEEMNDFLHKTFILKDIHFPKVYDNFMLFTPSKALELAIIFYDFQDCFVRLSCLILDELVEKGYFGENWEDFFLNTINEKSESVYYNPELIDYTDTPELQKAFEDILLYHVHYIIHMFDN